MSDGFKGAIFDVDGVLVDSPHEQAWRQSLQELMEGPWSDIRPQTTWTPEGFTSELYHQRMSGKPRKAGATAALEYFGVPDIGQARDRVRRAQAGHDHPADQGREVLRLRRRGALRHRGQERRHPGRGGLVVEERRSSSSSASTSGRYGGSGNLHEAFDVDVSGRDFAEGKPNPEIFLTAARSSGSTRTTRSSAEDATNGVQAARAGEFGALGVSRADNVDALRPRGRTSS